MQWGDGRRSGTKTHISIASIPVICRQVQDDSTQICFQWSCHSTMHASKEVALKRKAVICMAEALSIPLPEIVEI